jgi:branched-subunit amino acid aminotransferase/4-amino-4-deoxychorismate lyase
MAPQSDGPDGRIEPRVKGPDLEWSLAARRAGFERGAGEVALLDHSGCVLEGALSALVWWRVACCAPRRSSSRCRPADLAGAEVWSLSALHGIRPVTAWLGAGVELAVPRRADAWQASLAVLAHPVSDAVLGSPASGQ